MPTQDLQIYFQRWQAFDVLINDMTRTYESLEFPRKNTILHLLKSLQAFGAGQFQFFYYGLGPEGSNRRAEDLRLEPKSEYPVEDILTGILEQIGHDLELIQRAANQRLSGSERIRQTLATADKLAWLAVKPAVNYSVIEEATTVLTHFEKAAEFYRIPYAQVALIGIPFTCTYNGARQDYLAIPHEVGHYVYRHLVGIAHDQLDELRRNLDAPAEYQDWLKAIFEEMCADIYGCLIAGPVMALDFQSLSLANSQADFRGGDGSHPNAALRPLIYCQVLHSDKTKSLTEDDWRPIAEKLVQLWSDQLDERGPADFVINRRFENTAQTQLITAQKHSIAQVIEPLAMPKTGSSVGPLSAVVHKIVEAILERITAYVQNSNITRPLKGWSGPIDENTQVDQLFDAYRDGFDKLVAEVKVMPPEADPIAVNTQAGDSGAHTTQLWQAWLLQNNPKFKGAWPKGKVIPAGEVIHADLMENGTWGSILFADGWDTSGPSNDFGHPAK